VDLGDRTLVFDALGTPAAAEDLRAAAERLTGRPATYVTNSHADHDHWLGNQAFDPGTIVLSTSGTRERMVTEGAAYIRRCREHPELLEEQIRAIEERWRSETDERWRVSLAGRATGLRNELAALPTLDLRFPDQTFEHKVVFHGPRRTVELHTWGGGHSSSDAFALLPAERIALMGDIGFFQLHFPLMGGDRRTLTTILERLTGLDLETYVPGHGPLGTEADVRLQIQYIRALEALAAQVVEAGGSADEAARQPIPAPFDAWSHGMGLFGANMRTLHRCLSGG
jgi:glyoxylase-like metal-dependent hydrolase (beta-lactamase superfamily II)